MITLKEIAEQLKTKDDFAILFHVRPDGDSVGSGLALYRALLSLGKSVSVICSDVIPSRFSFLPNVKDIKTVFDRKYSVCIALDCADIERMGDNAYEFSKCTDTFNIDHHATNTRFAKTNYVFDTASNCENVYSLIKELGVGIDKDTANALLMGILTDTGGFHHRNVVEETLKSAGELVGLGADITDLSYRMFTNQSKERAKLHGKAMSSIKYFLDDKLGIITMFKRDFIETGAKREDTEGFIDFVMGIDTVKVGIALTEMDNGTFKASMRSKGPDVSKIAGVYGGGGHVLASGCQLSGDYYEVLDKLVYTVSQYLDD